jgi:flagellar protein FliO/FliZ
VRLSLRSTFALVLLIAVGTNRVLAEPAARPFAAPQGTTAEVGTLSSLGEITLALLVVLGAIFAFAWLARRARMLAGGAQGRLTVVAELPLGPKERAVLLRVNGAELLLGVAPGRVSMLQTFPAAADLAAGADARTADAQPAVDGAMQDVDAPPLRRAPSFAELLRKSLGR